jgi:hypothetical protein
MSKGSRQRAMPSTPQARPVPDAAAPDEPTEVAADEPTERPARARRRPTPPPRREEPAYLITGTECLAGHERGHELEAGRLGAVPTKKASRIGFGLVLWCTIGIAFVVDRRWVGLGLQLVVIWLIYSAIVQRRFGHRRRCWRTRTWRHAWGGLAMGTSDPTRPAGT